MGLQNRNVNINYVKCKNGKFYLGKDAETSYDQLDGQITNMYYKNEEYEGVPQRKLIVVVTDGDENYQLGFNVDSSNYSTFISFLKDADLSKPLTLHPKMDIVTKDGKESKKYAILISQNGKFNKSYFTKEVAEKIGVPQWDIVIVGKKKVTDKSAYIDFLEDWVNKTYINKINKNTQVLDDVKAVNTKTTITTNNVEVIVEDEPFPWD